MGINVILIFAGLIIIFGIILIIYSIFNKLKNKKILKILIPGCVLCIIGVGLISLFSNLSVIDTDYYLNVYSLDETPPYLFNMSEEQINALPYLKEGIEQKSYEKEISKEAFWKIHDFFEDNNYEHLGMNIYIKYQDSFYEIELITTA